MLPSPRGVVGFAWHRKAEFRRLLHTGVAAATAAGVTSTDGSTRESRAASFAAARNDWHGRGAPAAANGINPSGGELAEWGVRTAEKQEFFSLFPRFPFHNFPRKLFYTPRTSGDGLV